MSRLENYIYEAKIEVTTDLIKKNCKHYLKIAKGIGPLYKGLGYTMNTDKGVTPLSVFIV